MPLKAAHEDAVHIERRNSQLISSYAIEGVPLAIYDIIARGPPRSAGEGTRTDRMENVAARPPSASASLLGGPRRKRYQVTRMLAPMQINKSQKEKVLTTAHELR